MVYSLDGKELLSGSCDSTLMVWDLKKAKPARTLQGHKNKSKSGSMQSIGPNITKRELSWPRADSILPS